MDYFDLYYEGKDPTLCPYYMPHEIEYIDTEKYTVRKIEDHKAMCYYFLTMGTDITRQEVCDCQRDIYAIINQETNEIICAIMGRRIQEEDTVHHVIKNSETFKRTFYLITCFQQNITELPDFNSLTILLVEYLADKNYCMTRYKLTGNETQEMLDAMKEVGFKEAENGEYTRMPIPSKYATRI